MGAKKKFSCLSLSFDQHIARVELNRPPVNALNAEFISELTAAAHHIASLPDMWIVSVCSAIEIFCAGADLKERAQSSHSATVKIVANIQRMVPSWLHIPQPVLMQIQGAAFGGGLEFALTGDFIIASSKAVLGFPEVGLGIIPGGGGTQTLMRRTSAGIAKKWILTGNTFSAQEACGDGVVDKVVPEESLNAEFRQFEQLIVGRAPLALRKAKQALRDGMNIPLDAAFKKERSNYLPLIRTQDRKEALQAFLEKRVPLWKGK